MGGCLKTTVILIGSIAVLISLPKIGLGLLGLMMLKNNFF